MKPGYSLEESRSRMIIHQQPRVPGRVVAVRGLDSLYFTIIRKWPGPAPGVTIHEIFRLILSWIAIARTGTTLGTAEAES